MPYRFLALPIAFFFDMAFGDIKWKYHPDRLLEGLITFFEKRIRKTRPSYQQNVDEKTLDRLQKREFWGGLLEVVLVCLITFLLTLFIISVAYDLFFGLGFFVETMLCSFLLQSKSLRLQAMECYRYLRQGDLEAARLCVSHFVGHEMLSNGADDTARAAVEGICEETSDGTITPLIGMAIGGVSFMALCKAVIMLDDRLGHRTGLYLYFGRAAARLDDVVNFLPSRLAGCLIVASAYLMGFDGKNAKKIFLRDRNRHESPNSAQAEAAMAGALNIQLGGRMDGAVMKPFIGDANRPVELEDIPRANRIFLCAAILALLLCMVVFGILH